MSEYVTNTNTILVLSVRGGVAGAWLAPEWAESGQHHRPRPGEEAAHLLRPAPGPAQPCRSQPSYYYYHVINSAMFAAPDPATHFVPTAPSVRTRAPESSHTRGHGEQQPEMESARQQLHQSAAQQVTTRTL